MVTETEINLLLRFAKEKNIYVVLIWKLTNYYNFRYEENNILKTIRDIYNTNPQYSIASFFNHTKTLGDWSTYKEVSWYSMSNEWNDVYNAYLSKRKK